MLPSSLISSLYDVPGFSEASFCEAHAASDPPVSIRVNAAKWNRLNGNFDLGDAVPWSQNGFYLTKRPVFTLDPLLHAGAYYVQEASSMFLEQALRYILSQTPILLALDLCAAPGGKSTHLASLLPQNAVLVCNEVIAARTGILMENMVKWGAANVMITQNDPTEFGKLGPQFDLILVDAPCSGSGLFRRDPSAINEWSEQAVNLCSQRQQRILANALPALSPGGYLIYATCSFSPAEDESILDWLLKQGDLQSHKLPEAFEENGVVMTQSPQTGGIGYRFFPDRVKGEGFFMALLQKKGEGKSTKKNGKLPKNISIPLALTPWIKADFPLMYYEHKGTLFGMPLLLLEFFLKWKTELNIRKSGIRLGEVMHGKFNPDHDFALSQFINPEAIQTYEVDEQIALQYLRRKEIQEWKLMELGWILLTYKSLPIGWVKNLGNRYNNYYPTAWRIRME